MSNLKNEIRDEINRILSSGLNDIETSQSPFVMVRVIYDVEMSKPQNEYTTQEYPQKMYAELPVILYEALGEDMLRAYIERTKKNLSIEDLFTRDELVDRITKAFNKKQMRLYAASLA